MGTLAIRWLEPKCLAVYYLYTIPYKPKALSYIQSMFLSLLSRSAMSRILQETNSNVEENLETWMLDSNSKVLCEQITTTYLHHPKRGAQILDANRYTTFGSPSSRQCQTDRRRKHLYNLNKRLTLNCTSLSDSNVLRAAGLGTCVLRWRFSVCEPELQDSDNQL